MKKTLLIIVMATVFFACKNENKQQVPEENTGANEEIALVYKTYGDPITEEGFVEIDQLREIYKNLSLGDSTNVKIVAEVREVCKKKGCWIRIDLENDEEAMMRFKDYAFFMPEDIQGKRIIAEGIAFVEELNVDKQRHYAEDGGASAEEILAITEPKITYSFLAEGVLIPED